MVNTEFFDEEAVIRLAEAILSQLQMDYMKAYIKYLKFGSEYEIYSYGKGRRQRCIDMIREMEEFIRSSTMTAEYDDAIITELRRQAEEAVSKGKNAHKMMYRRTGEDGRYMTF